MTNNDLRMDYKKDTGLNADSPIERETELDPDLTIPELNDYVDVEVDLDADNVPYIEWLEEKLIKLLAK